MDRSAIILAGGYSERFGQYKGLVLLAGKPLIKHVLDAANNVVDERLIVVSSATQVKKFAKAVSSDVNVIIDEGTVRSPLIGALAGFMKARGDYSLLLPCDVPLVSKDVLALLFELCIGKAATIPRWPNGYIEPLQAVYHTKSALEAARKALMDGKLDMRSMIERLRGVHYVPTSIIKQLDPELKTFLNVNAPSDLKRAELALKRLKRPDR